MIEPERQISTKAKAFLKENLKNISDYQDANTYFLHLSGIHDFFYNREEFGLFSEIVHSDIADCDVHNRREYGDFQTPSVLTDQICALMSQHISPTLLIEPTFGKGTFIISALRHFSELRSVYGIEIYDSYCWETKFNILELYITHPNLRKPDIYLFCENIFSYDFKKTDISRNDVLLILGNPPWVTNTELSKLDSENIPEKSNFRLLRGIDAITGKSNFDISEHILLIMFSLFSNYNGEIAMLVKNSVIKNIIQALPMTQYRVNHLRASAIDTKKHFDASVEASLFQADFNVKHRTYTCDIQKPASSESERTFGWVDKKFVSDIRQYQEIRKYDSVFPFMWRQGIKHDCAKVMELEISESGYVNGFGEPLSVEDDLVYGLLKSSDLKQPVIRKPRKHIIVTQKKVGEDTAYLSEQYPQLYSYLQQHRSAFEKRKSGIYKNKPLFSIFGVGDYSFKPYKVAVSGLYKKPNFSLLLSEDKPLMLDDTCYFVSFDDIHEAMITWALLNTDICQKLIHAITFTDDKRPYTKQTLMRLGIAQIAQDISYELITKQIYKADEKLMGDFTESIWNNVRNRMMKSKLIPSHPIPIQQMNLFN